MSGKRPHSPPADGRDGGIQAPESVKLMEEGAGPMSRLPIEWLEQVLDFLPTRRLFVVMSVNREWNAAAKYIVKNRKCLILFRSIQHRMYEGTLDYDSFGIKVRDNMMQQVMRSLMLMQGLEKLIVFEVDMNLVKELILENAACLKILSIGGPLPTRASVTFSGLLYLQCKQLDADGAAACPKLQTLVIGVMDVEGAEFVTLPDVLMPSVTKLVVIYPEFRDSEITAFVVRNASTICFMHVPELPAKESGPPLRFDRLTNLKCDSTGYGFRDRKQRHVFPSLQHVSITESGREQVLGVEGLR